MIIISNIIKSPVDHKRPSTVSTTSITFSLLVSRTDKCVCWDELTGPRAVVPSEYSGS